MLTILSKHTQINDAKPWRIEIDLLAFCFRFKCWFKGQIICTVFPHIVSAETIFFNSILYTVTFGNSTFRCGNYSREETIQGRKLYEEIRYVLSTSKITWYLIRVLCFIQRIYSVKWKVTSKSKLQLFVFRIYIFKLNYTQFTRAHFPKYGVDGCWN